MRTKGMTLYKPGIREKADRNTERPVRYRYVEKNAKWQFNKRCMRSRQYTSTASTVLKNYFTTNMTKGIAAALNLRASNLKL